MRRLSVGLVILIIAAASAVAGWAIGHHGRDEPQSQAILIATVRPSDKPFCSAVTLFLAKDADVTAFEIGHLAGKQFSEYTLTDRNGYSDVIRAANVVQIPLAPSDFADAKQLYAKLRSYQAGLDRTSAGVAENSTSMVNAALDGRKADKREITALMPTVCPGP